MRIPVKSERDAFRLAYGGALVVGTAVALGALVTPLAGVALVVGVIAGAVAWELATKDPDRVSPLREAAAAVRSRPGERHRVLVVANQTVGGRELRDEVMLRSPRDVELRVVCPILPSRAHFIASDIDRELAEARVRLDRTLAWASERGFSVSGTVSEETPLVAVADALRRFPADEIIVSTHPDARSKWLQDGLVDRLREDLDIPVVHVIVDLERQPEAAHT